MDKNVRFYICPICGNQIGMIKNNGPKVICCGQEMQLMEANTSDGATEKHVPVCNVEGNHVIVKVGEIEHPMEDDHYIMWIAQVSENKTTRVRLHPKEGTKVQFDYIPNSTIYTYCNKHGLWKTDVK